MVETVLYDKRDRMAFVTLNRPEAKNAVDPGMHDELCRIWRYFRDDDDVDVAILSGAGDTFCAGADLRTYAPANYVNAVPSRVREIVDLGLGGLTRGLHKIRKPVITAIDGWALAAGLELALACGLRVASDRAMLGSFEARRGFHHSLEIYSKIAPRRRTGHLQRRHRPVPRVGHRHHTGQGPRPGSSCRYTRCTTGHPIGTVSLRGSTCRSFHRLRLVTRALQTGRILRSDAADQLPAIWMPPGVWGLRTWARRLSCGFVGGCGWWGHRLVVMIWSLIYTLTRRAVDLMVLRLWGMPSRTWSYCGCRGSHPWL